MKINIKLTLSLLLLILCCYACARTQPKEYADYSDWSGFVVENPDSLNLDNLVVLGKVWGFAKYHHPVFADSVYNIDYELFELLPKVAYAGKSECNKALFDWVSGLGKFKTIEKKYLKEIAEKDYILAADVGWLYDTELLGKDLSGLLQKLQYAKRPKPSRYAQYNEWTWQADFSAESERGPSFSGDTGYDLLTLFRLWNMAEYYFPSVNITDKKWADVLPEYVPKFTETDHIYWTTAELIAELCDTHSGMSKNPVYSRRRIPVELKFVENKPTVTDNRKFLMVYEEPEFEVGDEIISIDGHSPDYFIERARKYISASNESVLLRDAARLATEAFTEEITAVVERCGQQMQFVVEAISAREYDNRRKDWLKTKTYYELLNDSIGYLYPGKYQHEDAEAIMTEFSGSKAIIIDMRCYPSAFMPFGFIARYFTPKSIPHVVWTKPVVSLPGYFKKDPVSLGQRNKNYYKGKVVVLVNEETQSQAEYTTIAFQACPHTIVVGSQTAGADGNIVSVSLPRDIWTLLSGLGVYYPDGTNTQRAGVRIDHYIEPTVEGIKQGRDELLEKALEIINSAR